MTQGAKREKRYRRWSVEANAALSTQMALRRNDRALYAAAVAAARYARWTDDALRRQGEGGGLTVSHPVPPVRWRDLRICGVCLQPMTTEAHERCVDYTLPG